MDIDHFNLLEARIRTALHASSDEVALEWAKVILLNDSGMSSLENQSDASIKSKAWLISKNSLPSDVKKLLRELRERIA